jgi:hypothetical protein
MTSQSQWVERWKVRVILLNLQMAQGCMEGDRLASSQLRLDIFYLVIF